MADAVTPAERQRLWRRRQRSGEIPYSVALGDVELLALVELGLLTAEETADRRLVGNAAREALQQLARRQIK